jgi:hypothetical protein
MKSIATFFKALISLGWLGVVILLMAGLMGAAFFSQSLSAFDGVQEQMSVLNGLEDEVKVSLRWMMLQEAYAIFSSKHSIPPEEDFASQAVASDGEISASLQSLENQRAFSGELIYGVDLTNELKVFNDLRATHRQTFQTLLDAYQANNEESINKLQDQIEAENSGLILALDDLIVQAEQGRLAALNEFPADVNWGVRMTAGALVGNLLLALIGYLVISQRMHPLIALRSTVIAIAGGQYRPELLGMILKTRGSPGKLARALDALHTSLQQHGAGKRAEIERLRHELYESRRRRLKLTRPAQTGSEQL